MLQAVKVEAQLGFYAGYAPQTLSVTGETLTDEGMPATHLHGFFGGLHFGFGIADNLSINASLQIRMNSANSKGTQSNIQDWQFIADVPLMLSCGYPLNDKFSIGAFVGPMLSYGISYTHKTTDATTYEVVSSVNRYDTYDPELALRRFEVNACAGIFAKYRDFMLFGGYRLGLNDLDKRDNVTVKPRGFFVGIGFN